MQLTPMPLYTGDVKILRKTTADTDACALLENLDVPINWSKKLVKYVSMHFGDTKVIGTA
ncbi:unnamed protein product [Schistosoma curassoni]|uniref:RBD domain-containing protein n=1 Tax=Schistosoma curassoni TaxID=6186 RepID=A0A183KTA0_9TREM|nr:unnamed protein product [Schistosoma curassoni]